MASNAPTRTEQPAANILIRGSGPPLLILHGWGSSAELMLPIADALGSQRRCVAVDFPGHGDTPPPDRPWGVDEFVVWTLALMDRLELSSPDILAHSHGARIALSLAARHPGRANRLVLTGAAGIRQPPSLRQRSRTRIFKAGRGLAANRLVPPPTRRYLEAWVQRQGSPDYRSASGVMRDTLVRLVNSDVTGLLRDVKASTLLIWGDHDDETPLSAARILEAQIPDCGLAILPGGHFVYAEQLPQFARICQTFLGAET